MEEEGARPRDCPEQKNSCLLQRCGETEGPGSHCGPGELGNLHENSGLVLHLTIQCPFFENATISVGLAVCSGQADQGKGRGTLGGWGESCPEALRVLQRFQLPTPARDTRGIPGSSLGCTLCVNSLPHSTFGNQSPHSLHSSLPLHLTTAWAGSRSGLLFLTHIRIHRSSACHKCG